MNTPRNALLNLMKRREINCLIVWSPENVSRLVDNGLQEAAIEMLVHEKNICLQRKAFPMKPVYREDGVILGVPRREGVDCRYVLGGPRCNKIAISWRELETQLPNPPLPAFVADLGMINKLLDEEVASLKVQLGVALSVVRRYLWDPHLVLTSARENTGEWLFDVMGKAKVTITREKPGRVLWSMGADRVIILRPDAEEPLTVEDVVGADAFVVGGIVDKIPRRGVSKYLDASVPWGEPRKIVLRGSLIGVPDRINRIIEIIFRILFENYSVEEAVIKTMTKRDIMKRLTIEIMKASRGGKKVLDKSHYELLKSWLPITCQDYITAARKARVTLGWKCEG